MVTNLDHLFKDQTFKISLKIQIEKYIDPLKKEKVTATRRVDERSNTKKAKMKLKPNIKCTVSLHGWLVPHVSCF